MLVLSRKLRQAVVIGGNGTDGHCCRVTVLEVRGGTVRLGFDADVSTLVLRSEVVDQSSDEERNLQIERLRGRLK